jgi:maltooligosyltrehalose trehalohydrolase
MPVAQFPGERNWGYDGVDLYAPQNSYGGPEGLRQLVDAAHAEGLAVILDVVYNHVGPEGNYLNSFGPYFTEKYKTPWGPTVNYDDAQSDEVRRFVIDNALYWITEYHVDGLRLDAVHGIFDMSAKHLLQELAEAVHARGEALGRRVIVIGESDLNDPRLLRTPEEGGYGLDAQWSDDFHHAVHAALTGETLGYYSDFGSVETIGASLTEPFVYDGCYSAHRKRRHGGPSTGIPRSKFVVAIQNHDQIGNRASGDRLTTTLAPDQLRLAAALLLLSPYVPLLFMGEEYGERNPFQYFVSHSDPQLADAVREGRRKEFEAFGWGDDVPDPLAEDTFQRSKLDHGKMARSQHAQLFALYRDLLALRREEPLLRPDGAELSVEYTADGWITMLRTERASFDDGRRPDHALLAVFNCSSERREMALPEQVRGSWTLRLTTDAAGYGGADQVTADVLSDDGGDGTPSRTWAPSEAGAPKRLVDTGGIATQTRRTLTLPKYTSAVFTR